jgi:hypothetical protein
MHRLTIEYGQMPTRGMFNRALLEAMRPNYPIRFRNDSRIGNADLDGDQLYRELLKAHRDGTKESLEWLRRHLYFLDIHWDSGQ